MGEAVRAASGTLTRSRLAERLREAEDASLWNFAARLPRSFWSALAWLAGLAAVFFSGKSALGAFVLVVAAGLSAMAWRSSSRLERQRRWQKRLLDPDGESPGAIRATPQRAFLATRGWLARQWVKTRRRGISTRLYMNDAIAAFRQEAIRHQSRVAKMQASAKVGQPPASLDLGEFGRKLQRSLEPRAYGAARLDTRIRGPRADFEPDQVWPALRAYPSFKTCLYGRLNASEKIEILLRGAQHLLPNSVTLLEVNPRYVEAFLVGANHEMAREFLWREVPIDLRGTFFQRFWNTGEPPLEDIAPIHQWEGELGENTRLELGENLLVVLIRGDLAHRFPNVYLTMHPAQANNEGRFPNFKEVLTPVVQGRIGKDAIFRGYTLSVEQALGGPDNHGWFFSIAERASEIRFGLDESSGDSLTTWDDLSWQHLEPVDSHVRLARPVPLQPEQGSAFKWGKSSAHMAAITMQKPFRLAIHAADMLACEGQGDRRNGS